MNRMPSVTRAQLFSARARSLRCGGDGCTNNTARFPCLLPHRPVPTVTPLRTLPDTELTDELSRLCPPVTSPPRALRRVVRCEPLFRVSPHRPTEKGHPDVHPALARCPTQQVVRALLLSCDDRRRVVAASRELA